MKRLRVLIADDEALAREGIALLLARDPEIEVVGTCADGEATLQAIRTHRPDLVFLDIQMPHRSGIDLLAELSATERPAIIFVTAFNQYAVQAFDLGSFDYVVKPFRDDRFYAAVARAKERLGRRDMGDLQRSAIDLIHELQKAQGLRPAPPPAHSGNGSSRPARIVFRVENEHVFLNAADIAWIEAQGESIRVRAGGQNHPVRETLIAVEKRLDPYLFVRVHRSFIVNRNCIKKISPTLYGDHTVHMADGTKVRLSRTYRDKLKVLLLAITP